MAQAMDPRFSEGNYPRRDNVYKAKKSLDFDLMRTKIFIQRTPSSCHNFMEWVAYALTGIFTGLTAAIMTQIEEDLTDFRRNTASDIINQNEDNLLTGWLFFSGISASFVLVSSLATVFWGPGANGSGVAELIGYLNGINYPNVFGFETFVTKVFGVVLAVVGGLCVGKEGPLAHIGACCGVMVLYLPLPFFNRFQNDVNKRNLIAAGTSAGVSAAFGAPIGGALFAYEISKPSTFWKFSVIWKVFFTCALAVFTLAICNGLMAGQAILSLESAVLKFGSISISPPTLEVIPGAIICGAITGLLGGIFVIVNSNLGLLRKKYITSNVMKIVEAVFFSIATTSVFYWAPKMGDCKQNLDASYQDLAVAYTCPPVAGQTVYNPMATLLFNTEGDAIRTLISQFESAGGVVVNYGGLLAFSSIWYFFTIVTYGCWVPAGLFLPGIIIGCAIGGLYSQFQLWLFGSSLADTFATGTEAAVTPVLVAAGGMLAGYTRLTYSLVVIMLETTSSIDIFIPMMISVLTSRAVGSMLCASLYDRALRMKQMPYIRSRVPTSTAYKKICEIMNPNVVSLSSIAKMDEVIKALNTSHNQFPVLNTAGKLVGIVPKRAIVRLLEKKMFYDKSMLDRQSLLEQRPEEQPENDNLLNQSTQSKNFYDDVWHADYDAKNGFPESMDGNRLLWYELNTNINSDEADSKWVLENVCDDYKDEWLDLRPYLNENPCRIPANEQFLTVVEKFRLLNLRHILVTDPSSGDVQGIITRKDIFAYMSL